MANLTRQLVQLSFEGIPFPYKEIGIDFELRDHVHEFPHSPGGLPEKLGRKLYVFDITSSFYGDMLQPQYKDLWPGGLSRLFELFEAGKTGDLILPQVGAPIRAYCTNGKRTLRSAVVNGEAVTLKFREDSEKLRLSAEALRIKAVNYGTAKTALDSEIRKLPSTEVSLFDQFMRAVSSVLAYKDQFDLYSESLEAKLGAVIEMGRELVESCPSVKDVTRSPLLDALHQILAETIKIYKDQQQTGLITSRYTVARPSTLSEVAIAIYGVSGKARDLMLLNTITNPLLIPVGTVLRYYKD
jgi:hypothetical protein